MKLLFSEHPATYESYRFPYQVWALEEPDDDHDTMLNIGLLPTRFKIGLWYMARSSRVNLADFELSSENRRVIKNTQQYTFTTVNISDFVLDELRLSVVKSFIDSTISADFSDSSIKRIFSPHLTDVVAEWYEGDTLVGICPIMATETGIFYWYGFYDTSLQKTGIGMRMMLEAITSAKDAEKSYAYIGTIYTQSSLYKTNFSGLQFYNGIDWPSNNDELKFLIKRDNDKTNSELFKDPHYLDIAYDARNIGELLKKLP